MYFSKQKKITNYILKIVIFIKVLEKNVLLVCARYKKLYELEVENT